MAHTDDTIISLDEHREKVWSRRHGGWSCACPPDPVEVYIELCMEAIERAMGRMTIHQRIDIRHLLGRMVDVVTLQLEQEEKA